MKTLFSLFLVLCAIAAAQTPVPVTVCWTPQGGQQACHTFEPGSTTMITVDLRNNPVPAVVLQPLPAYQMKAMQSFVDGQTYRQQQADGSVVVKRRYDNVQDLLVQHLVKVIIVPSLKLYPPDGEDAGKTTMEAAKTDLLNGLLFFPAFVF